MYHQSQRDNNHLWGDWNSPITSIVALVFKHYVVKLVVFLTCFYFKKISQIDVTINVIIS